MATDSFDFAIANALVRLHLDKSLNLHPSGVENKNSPCLSFHMINNLYLVKTTDPLDSAPPLELSVFERKNRHLLGVDVCSYVWYKLSII